ncbi:contact-dependent growth inhibition system immunity protein [Achromobacter sp.]|uniref:contact-dependent growth inhibition system immunity protein n=1 Tax=Achromobacter sp. TaxID=134375 RepID=UPI003C72A45A
MSVELAVPIGFAGAIKAVRASSVIAGRISLSRHEASVLGGIGGHTIGKHVGKTKGFLDARLRTQPRLLAASTFYSIQDAERAINGLMRNRAADIRLWAVSAPANDVLRLSASISDDVGVVLVRGATEVAQGRKLTIALKNESFNGMPYYLLIAFLGPLENRREPYPELEQFIGAYFNEDFEIFGDTIEEIALCYKRVVGETRI